MKNVNCTLIWRTKPQNVFHQYIHVFVSYKSPLLMWCLWLNTAINPIPAGTWEYVQVKGKGETNFSNQNLLTFTDPSYLKNDYQISTTSCLPCSCTTHLLNFDLQQCHFCLLNINLNTIHQTGINKVLEMSSSMEVVT